MSICVKKYDFGSELPSGISFPEVIKYQVSRVLRLPGIDVFEKELRERYDQVVAESFNTAIEHLIVHNSFKKLLEQGLDAVYTSYIADNGDIDKIYTACIKSRAEKVRDAGSRAHDPDQVYTTYLAVSILTDLLREGKDSCETYIGMYPFSIVNAYGDHRARSTFISQELVLKMYTNGTLDKPVYDALDNPENTAKIVRKVYFKAYADALIHIKKVGIFTVFAEKTAKSAHPDLDVSTVLRQQLSELSYKDKSLLIDKVYRLHELGIIASNVDITTPSKDDVDQVVSQPIPSTRKVSFDGNVINFADTALNYTAHLHELYIDGLYFPTISHYVYYVLAGKKYTRIYANEKFVPTPSITSAYILVGDITSYFNRAILCNEIYGIGDKYTHDVYSLEDTEYDAIIANKSPLDDEIAELAIVSSQLLKRNADLFKLKKVIPSAISWVESRMDVAHYVYNILPIQQQSLTSQQLGALQRLLSGSCAPSTPSGDVFSEIKKHMYVAMRDILLKDSRLTPSDVLEYARRVVSPKIKSKLPREISHAVMAVKYVLANLSVILASTDPTVLVRYAFKIISGKESSEAKYDDYTKIIAQELGVSEQAAALVNGFIGAINLDDDVTHRRVTFYSAMY